MVKHFLDLISLRIFNIADMRYVLVQVTERSTRTSEVFTGRKRKPGPVLVLVLVLVSV